MMVDVGVVHGRFQVLHNDHLKYILAARRRCGHLVVGLTNPDPRLTGDDPADPARSRPESNPLTYFERYTMAKAVLVDEGLSLGDFTVVPLPINFPELYRYYVPLDAVFYLTVYDGWGRRKRDWFRELGLKTDVLWDKPAVSKGITGAEVRRRIAAGALWEDLVPPATAELVRRWNLKERLRTT